MIQALTNWKKRHRNRTNFWLHMAGIPASFVAAPAMLVFGQWWPAAAAFAAGYALQFVGHLVEGNRSGEEELLRRLLARGRPPRAGGRKQRPTQP